jgi:hypothetical protein
MDSSCTKIVQCNLQLPNFNLKQDHNGNSHCKLGNAKDHDQRIKNMKVMATKTWEEQKHTIKGVQ